MENINVELGRCPKLCVPPKAVVTGLDAGSLSGTWDDFLQDLKDEDRLEFWRRKAYENDQTLPNMKEIIFLPLRSQTSIINT
jgi:hypothetical protein